MTETMPPNLMSVSLVFTAVKSVYSMEDPCEVSNHDTSLNHIGIGKWYARSVCPSCGDTTVVLICDSFRKYLNSVLTSHTAPCGTCTTRVLLKDAVKEFTRKG